MKKTVQKKVYKRQFYSWKISEVIVLYGILYAVTILFKLIRYYR